jgi:aldose 1-epimerase
LAVLTALPALTALPSLAAPAVTGSLWGTMPDGRPVRLFTLTNDQKTRVVLAEYGALLVSVETADRQGRVGPVTLSYRSLDEALAGGVLGSVIGRFANRIGNGGFTIDGTRYDLGSVNQDGVHIHGGATGFHRQLWTGMAGSDAGAAAVVFSIASPDGHEGYPGKMEVSVTYTLTNDNVLRLDYAGTTDRPTHLNLTNHVYFNLAGGGDIREHVLRMDCAQVLAIDPRKVPTGALLDVAGTPFDFRVAKPVGEEIASVEGGGYDHCFVIPRRAVGKSGPVPFATLNDPSSGRSLKIVTTKPGVQIFTANSFKGEPFPKWGGICFETQFYPDTPNQPGFPTSLLRPGETYRHTTEFHFGITD